MATWSTKYDARGSGAERPITNEVHVVGEDLTSYVLLDEVPLEESPSTVTLTVGGVPWTEVTSPPGTGQFQVIYSGRLMGAIIFNALNNGTTVSVSYKGRGSNAYARDINKLQTKKLDADGAIPLSGALQLAHTGTALAPDLTFDNDLDTGLYRSAANAIGVAVAGAQVGNFTTTGLAITGLLAATTLSGDGSAITALNASNLASGTVPSARLAGSYTGITGVGTVTVGTWNGTAIANAYIATGLDVAKLTAGTTIPSNVVSSSLTSVGNLTALTVVGTSTLAGVTATSLTVARAGETITSNNTTSAAQINLHVVIQKNGATKANIGTDASDNLAVFDALGTTANLTLTNAGALTVRAAIAAAGATLSAGLTITAGGAAITGTVTATAFAGNGSSLTALNATQLTTGTVPSARVSGSYTGITGLGTITVGVWNGTAIADTYLATIATAGKVSNSATTATSANTVSAIVARDASGNFTAGTITAALTGNASTATALQNARTINGVSFDGTANITVAAAAGTLTGVTLNGTVVNSSLTSVGTLTTLSVGGAATFASSVTASGQVKSDGGFGFSVAGTLRGQIIIDGSYNWSFGTNSVANAIQIASATGAVTVNAAAAATSPLVINNPNGVGDQYYADFTAGATVIGRLYRNGNNISLDTPFGAFSVGMMIATGLSLTGALGRAISANGTSGSPVEDVIVAYGLSTSGNNSASIRGYNAYSSDNTTALRFYVTPSGSATTTKVLDLNGAALTLGGVNLLWSSDAGGNIGASSGNRPNNIYMAGALGVNAALGGSGSITASGVISTSSSIYAANNIGIGLSPLYPLHVERDRASDLIAYLVNSNSSTPYGMQVRFLNAAPNNTTYYLASFNDSAGARCIIYSNGNVVNSNNSYGTLSDRRLKQDIVQAGSQWEDVKVLSAAMSKFRFKSDPEGHLQLGWIAQDVQAISPGLVFETPERDSDGNLTGKMVLGVHTSIALLKGFRAVGEALTEIDTLKLRVSQLEAEIALLRKAA